MSTTPESAGPVRHDLLLTALDGAPRIQEARVMRVELAPGMATGLHHHPCDVVGHIVEGTVRFQLDGRPEQVLRAGDAFHEPAGVTVPHFDNASADEPVVFVACYLLPPGEDRLIEMH